MDTPISAGIWQAGADGEIEASAVLDMDYSDSADNRGRMADKAKFADWYFDPGGSLLLCGIDSRNWIGAESENA